MEESQSAAPVVTQETMYTEAPAPEVTEALEAEKPVSPKVEEPKDDRFAAKFAALSRKEKAMRQQMQLIEVERKAAEALKTKYETEYSPYKNLATRIKQEPLKILEENGIKFADLAKMILENEGKPTEDMVAKNALGDLKSEIEQLKAQLKAQKEEEVEKVKEIEKKKHEQVLNNFVGEIKDHVDGAADKYELIRANDAVELVYNVIEQYHADTGEILDTEKAAEQVEAYLEEEAKKLFELSKFKKNGAAAQEKPSATPQPSRTLSNALASQAPSSGRKFMSNEESKAEASKLLRWED